MTAVPIIEIEPFVDVDVAAQFLVITRRHLLQLARGGQIPAHPIGAGKRRMWRFRLSEIANAISTDAHTRKRDIISAGSPRSRKEQSHG